MDKVAGDNGGKKNSQDREKQERSGIAHKVAHIQLNAALKYEGGQEKNQDDVRAGTIRDAGRDREGKRGANAGRLTSSHRQPTRPYMGRASASPGSQWLTRR